MENEIKVLDHGFVRLIDYLGDDQRIVDAARCSLGDKSKTKQNNRNLIRYMLRNHHTSPFEQVVFVFDCKMPIFVARQWVRHRTARLNELSGRYSEMPEEFYVPETDQVRAQSKSNKQGRDEALPLTLTEDFRGFCQGHGINVFKVYQRYLGDDIARETARINLPLSTYTQWWWQMDLNNLFHFLKLRMDEHAQWEIRQYANAIYEIIKPIVPLAVEAWEDYILNAKTFSKQEMQVLDDCLTDLYDYKFGNDNEEIEAYLNKIGKRYGLSKRELEEFKKKLGL